MRRGVMAFLVVAAAVVSSLPGPVFAQQSEESFVGTYDGGQTEVGAALVLGGDGRFEYYLSYGALDEMATGTWAVEDGAVVLDSDPVIAPSFEPLARDAGSPDSFEVALEAPPGLPVELFSATVLLSDGTARSGDFGGERLRFDLERGQAVAALWLEFPVYLVGSGRIEVPRGAGSMRFAFRPNDLGKVAFDHEVLREDEGALLLARYDRILRFRKLEDGPDEVITE